MLLRYLIRRLAQALSVLFGVTFLVFALMHVLGDPVALMLPGDATREQMDELRAAMGLDDPFLVQYGRFLLNAVRGDLGVSIRHSQPAMELVLERYPATVELAMAALAISLALGVPADMLSAVHRNRGIDVMVRLFALAGQSMPVFWLGILLMLFFGVFLGWFPIAGREGIRSLALPALTLGMYSMSSVARLLRSSMLEVLTRDYIRTARSKGLAERVVCYKHALRNAAPPVITMVALQFGILLGGAVVTEAVFSWPGVGSFVLQAISHRDLPVVEASVIIMATTFVLLNWMVDVLYGLLDPRIRF